MIELRWVDRYKISDPKISGYGGEREKALQYRQLRLRIDASGALTPLPDPEWSEWQDVPTVRED